ncbi:MAG: hypothetical protein LBU24_01660 [Methanocalculaceae archaeon]|jgi:site-specific DNA-methyltransferase (adenine-specific)|nr:hypothetical protein [Methanocalculaceae archaeon]
MQIGFNDSYETYINQLNLAWTECFRVLRDGCRMCVNVGDQFARSSYYGRYKVIPIHTEIIRFCESIGLDFMGQIIWQKTTTMNTTGGGAVMGSFPYPRNGIVKLDFEYILLFKKPGNAPKPSSTRKLAAKMTNEEWNTYFGGHWNFSGVRQDKHLAMFPEELPRRLIKMFSFPGEKVLDPFAGSGTTAKVARELGRSSINYEINREFISIIREKLGESNTFTEVKTVRDVCPELEILEARVHNLPYIFADVHKFDKKFDVKRLHSGLKIDMASSDERIEQYRVRSVIAPNLIKLSNDMLIRLIGIKPDPQMIEPAKKFLLTKFKGRRVFIKHDDIKFDDENRPLVYLYLDNKTFINAHLLKNKFALVDDSIPFGLADKFTSLRFPEMQNG